jgi:hypothetical protein
MQLKIYGARFIDRREDFSAFPPHLRTAVLVDNSDKVGLITGQPVFRELLGFAERPDLRCRAYLPTVPKVFDQI